MFRSLSLLEKLDFLRHAQTARIRFIRIHVNVQKHCRIDPDMHFFERHGRGTAHPQLHQISLLHAVKFRVFRIHVDMNRRANDAALELDHAFRSHDPRARRIHDVSRKPHGHVIQTEADRIRICQLDLRFGTQRTQDAQIRNHAAARPNERHHFVRRKIARLIKRTIFRQFVALAEQRIDICPAEVHVPRGCIHPQRGAGAALAADASHQAPRDDVPNNTLHYFP